MCLVPDYVFNEIYEIRLINEILKKSISSFKKNQFLLVQEYSEGHELIFLFGMVFQTRNMTGLEQIALFTQRYKAAAGLI